MMLQSSLLLECCKFGWRCRRISLGCRSVQRTCRLKGGYCFICVRRLVAIQAQMQRSVAVQKDRSMNRRCRLGRIHSQTAELLWHETKTLLLFGYWNGVLMTEERGSRLAVAQGMRRCSRSSLQAFFLLILLQHERQSVNNVWKDRPFHVLLTPARLDQCHKIWWNVCGERRTGAVVHHSQDDLALILTYSIHPPLPSHSFLTHFCAYHDAPCAPLRLPTRVWQRNRHLLQRSIHHP